MSGLTSTRTCLAILAALVMGLWSVAGHGQALKAPGAGLGRSSLERRAGVPARQVAPVTERAFGTEAESVYAVHSVDFQPEDSGNVWTTLIDLDPDTGFVLRAAAGEVFWLAPVRLPSGAEVTRIEVSGCDSHAMDQLQFALLETRIPAQTGNRLMTVIAETGAAATPGCAVFSTPVTAAPLIVDNATRSYAVGINTTGGNVVFDAARVFYRLRVSPGPAMASFTDVPPGHPFFQFVEALNASGITAGCAPTLYCVDDPITRGQIAVFLSKALGLHFAP